MTPTLLLFPWNKGNNEPILKINVCNRWPKAPDMETCTVEFSSVCVCRSNSLQIQHQSRVLRNRSETHTAFRNARCSVFVMNVYVLGRRVIREHMETFFVHYRALLLGTGPREKECVYMCVDVASHIPSAAAVCQTPMPRPVLWLDGFPGMFSVRTWIDHPAVCNETSHGKHTEPPGN